MEASTTSSRSVVSPLPDIIGLGGAVAGLVGGVTTVFVGGILTLVSGGDLWLQSKQIAAIALGADVANQAGFVAGPVVLGTVIHIVMSILLGAIFGIVSRRILKLPSDLGMPVWSGLVYGLFTWMIAYFVVLPVVNPILLDTYAPSFVIQHIVYGIVTGIVYAYLRPQPYIHTHQHYSAQ